MIAFNRFAFDREDIFSGSSLEISPPRRTTAYAFRVILERRIYRSEIAVTNLRPALRVN